MKPVNCDAIITASAADLRADRIRARRRIAVRVGLLVIAMTSATACIFDQGTYQGGGRKDHGGATAVTATTPPPPPEEGGVDAAPGTD